jgi:hypothetical protein
MRSKQFVSIIFSLVVIAMLSVVSYATEVFLRSAITFDTFRNTVTMPLFRGTHNGATVWYIVTESSDRNDAFARGVNFAPKLRNALGTVAVQTATLVNGEIRFTGTVDFSPTRVVQPGPTIFPPAVAQPGSIGDANYSPLITLGNGIVLNAAQVANRSGVLDNVSSIDYNQRTVTLELVPGFYNGKKILYLRTDASDPGAAALEASTYAPNLNAARGLSSNRDESARSGLVLFINGQTGANNPQRQGIISALQGEGAPLNVLQEDPNNGSGSPRYSPLWDVHPAVWTDAAIARKERQRLTDFSDIANAVKKGFITSGGSGPRNAELGGLRAAGFVVNCPIVLELDND